VKYFVKIIIFIYFVSICTLSCSDSLESTAETQSKISRSIFSTSVTNFEIHSFYEVGAEPYTGTIGLSGNDTWDITQSSYEALFSSHSGRTVETPSTLAEMTQISDKGKSSWTTSELVNLGNSIAPSLVNGTTTNISIIFLNGLFQGNSSVLGVHLSGTHFAFVFKDVVTGVGGDSISQRYVEQATVVHEIGHAIGFVNNGIPMASAHEDSDHPHHTTNDDGVMYWAVESTTGILTVLTDAITGNQLNLFGAESQADAQSFKP